MNDAGAILLVDGDDSFLSSTAERLRGDGYACECANTSSRAAEALQSFRYETMVAATNMEGNTDLELVVYAQQMARGMPVVLVTDTPSLDTAIAAVHLPVMAYLVKPLDYDEFREHIKRLTARSETHRTLSRVREHLNQCLQELNASTGDTANRSKMELLSLPLLRGIACCLSDLLRLRATITVEGPQQKLCDLLGCPEYGDFRQTMIQSIGVLEQSKSAMKSKQLMSLRLHLTSLLEG